MIKSVLTIFTASLLLGCQSPMMPGNADANCNSKATCSKQVIYHTAETHQDTAHPTVASGPQYVTNWSQVNSVSTHALPYYNGSSLNSNKQLSDYAAQMSMRLVETLHDFSSGASIAVVSFVELGAELEETSIIGNQLAESFMHQIQQFGLAVVDFKTTSGIKITPYGDFVFSRDLQRLNKQQHIDYVLSGTLLHTPRGIVVNARVINFKNKVVAASAQQLIPHFVISALYPAMHHG